MNPEEQHLQPTPIIDFDEETVRAFAERIAAGAGDPTERAVRLYYAVRDGIRYNPYKFGLTVESLKASATLAAGEAWCVPKAVLLAAGCRALGIPARLGFADVRNHLSTERMRKQMKTDVFHWHGYTSIYLGGKWVKATPAFNIELCEKFHLRPLEFDGKGDSIYHPFDLEGKKHMEYLRFRGEYDDVPLEEMMASFLKHYGGASIDDQKGADFDKDCDAEKAAAEE